MCRWGVWKQRSGDTQCNNMHKSWLKKILFRLRRKQTNSICDYFARHWSDKERKSAITVCWWYCASRQTLCLIKILRLTAPECLIQRLWLSDLVSKSTSGCLRASVLQVQRFKGHDKDRMIVLRITGEIHAIETAFDSLLHRSSAPMAEDMEVNMNHRGNEIIMKTYRCFHLYSEKERPFYCSSERRESNLASNMRESSES